MRRLILAAAMLCLTSALAPAGTWTGRLIDSDCWNRQARNPELPPDSCVPTRFTTRFAVQTPDGAVHRLDPTGNARAVEVMHGFSYDRPEAQVTIDGEQDDGVIRVEDIRIREIQK